MAYWLVKSDPDEYSFQDLQRDTTTAWTGVRNYAARLHLNAMKKGDAVLMYHSTTDKAVVGRCTVLKAAYPDPTSDDQQWVAVDLKAGPALPHMVTLDAMKKVPALANIGLIRIGRLSVMPLTQEEFECIVAMGSQD